MAQQKCNIIKPSVKNMTNNTQQRRPGSSMAKANPKPVKKGK